MNETNEILSELQRIQAEVLMLNEDNTINNQNNQNQDSNIDDDLDKLLQQTNDQNNQGNNQNNQGNAQGNENNQNNQGNTDSLDDIPDLNSDSEDSKENSGSESQNNNQGNGSQGDNKNFETDTQGLVDAITKLTKEGKTVKIVVSNEGREMALINNRKLVSLEELQEMVFPGRRKNRIMNNKISSLEEQVRMLSSRLQAVENGEAVAEERLVSIRESDYNMLLEMVNDLSSRNDEQAALIKNYEAMGVAVNEEEYQEMNDILDELDQSIDEMNRGVVNSRIENAAKNSYNLASDVSIGIMQETAIPIMGELEKSKYRALERLNGPEIRYVTVPVSEGRSYSQNNTTVRVIPKVFDTSELDECIMELDRLNTVDRTTNLVESLLLKKNYSKEDVLGILDEAASNIIVSNAENEKIQGIGNFFPNYEDFNTRVNRILTDGYEKSKKSASEISWRAEDDDLMPKTQNKKFELKVLDRKYNVTPTIKSAISNIQEALTDIDGKLDLAMCENVYLYKRVEKPQSIDDFAFPIAIMDENDHQLYAHPELIKQVANLLKSDRCVKTYHLKSKDDLYALREAIEPYLAKIGEEAPWKEEMKAVNG